MALELSKQFLDANTSIISVIVLSLFQDIRHRGVDTNSVLSCNVLIVRVIGFILFITVIL